jgi:hypothetical protein
MESSSAIEFSYPAWFRDLLWLWLLLLGAIIVVLDAAALFGLYSVYTSTRASPFRYAQGVVVLGTGAWMTMSFIHWVRDRHAFRTRYVLTEQSVIVEPHDGLAVSMGWPEFDCAVECRLCRYIRLSAPRLEHSVVLTFGAKGGSALPPREKFDTAVRLIQEKLGRRYARTWC